MQLKHVCYEMGVRSYVLDGDNIRTGFNKDLGLNPGDRKENNRRIAEVAKILVDAGILVFASFIAPYRESRGFVGKLMENWPYYECYIKCSLDANYMIKNEHLLLNHKSALNLLFDLGLC